MNDFSRYKGHVLASREENGYHDSDFYSIVYDADEDKVKRITTGSTRYAGGGVLPVDATDEVKAKATVALARHLAREKTIREDHRTIGDGVYGATVEVGDTVRSLTTRGKNKGIVGTVTKLASFKTGYSEWTRKHRVALEVEGEEKWRWMDKDRVEVVTKGTPRMTEAEIAEWAENAARSYAANDGWHAPFTKEYVLAMA